ncbi:MAG: oppA3 [Firmicutes bacterium]|nr:oppA3 [Bacillota bacterium]
MKKMKKSLISFMIMLFCIISVGCGSLNGQNGAKEKVFRYGTTAYGVAMENAGTNPHDTYCGWSTLRYGIGETLFKFNDNMELEPWLAKDFKQIDDYTLQIDLRDDITFSNGKKVTGEAVKACLDDLLAKHDRAPQDLKIRSIQADGQTVIITAKEKVPGLINYLADPYGAIIDMEAGEKDRIVVGTGPYKAEKVTDTEIDLVKNKNYWGTAPKVDRIIVKSITDGDTLTMAMQNGEIDAAQGLPYASLDLFHKNDKYKVSSSNTSRVYQAAFNYKTKALQDIRVRKAISMAIDKDGFTKVLLHGNGTPAIGAFPDNLSFGGEKVKAQPYDIKGAKALLKEAGYEDKDGDGYVEKNGVPLVLRWLTYTSRQELPLLAESAQASLKQIGIKIDVNATDNYKTFLKKGDYDIYAKAFVTAPTGDPEYYFTTHVLDSSVYNHGFYHNNAVEQMAEELHNSFDKNKKSSLAVKMQQELLDDCAFIYASHLKMSFVMKSKVTGFEVHPSDYYEITADLDI